MAPRKLAYEILPPSDSSSDDTGSEQEEDESDGLVDDQNGGAEKQEETDLESETTEAQPSPSLSAFIIKPRKTSPKPNRSMDSEEETILPSKKKSKAAMDDEEPKKGSEIKAVEKHQYEGDNVNVWEKYPLLGESLNSLALSEPLKVFLREKLGMLEKAKLEELEQKWKCVKKSELDLFVQRIELVNEQAQLSLDLIKSS